MASDSDKEKQQAHELLEQLAPTQLSAVVGLLEVMVDPVSRAIAHAPLDDERLSPEGESALKEAREWSKHNAGIAHEEVLAELGITAEEIDQVKGRK
jgi:hypothetical protein